MSISERDRRDMYVEFEGAFGESVANNIMTLLPFQPADELATRTDVLAMGSQLQGEMAELRGELRGEMAELRAEVRRDIAKLEARITGLEGSVDARITGLEGSVDARITGLEGSLRNEIANLRNHTTRMMAGVVAANTIAVITALAM